MQHTKILIPLTCTSCNTAPTKALIAWRVTAAAGKGHAYTMPHLGYLEPADSQYAILARKVMLQGMQRAGRTSSATVATRSKPTKEK